LQEAHGFSLGLGLIQLSECSSCCGVLGTYATPGKESVSKTGGSSFLSRPGKALELLESIGGKLVSIEAGYSTESLLGCGQEVTTNTALACCQSSAEGLVRCDTESLWDGTAGTSQ
jgi:hypothetical protein